ncbi:MAG: hypothetical protein JWM19_7134, partial [Actinomycetia bacterium]|nr:hypothetical protein [Actinomycetes bacterium]
NSRPVMMSIAHLPRAARLSSIMSYIEYYSQ